jgi:hypothetical protein
MTSKIGVYPAVFEKSSGVDSSHPFLFLLGRDVALQDDGFSSASRSPSFFFSRRGHRMGHRTDL